MGAFEIINKFDFFCSKEVIEISENKSIMIVDNCRSESPRKTA